MPLAGVDWLMGRLPRWLQGPITRDVFGAVGAQLDDIDALAIADQLFVMTATWGLAYEHPNGDGTTTPTGWERDLGIPVAEADGYVARRLRVLAKLQGGAARSAADFAELVEDLLQPPATCPPTVYQQPARWAIFKPCDMGFPTNFDAVEAALGAAGPAHIELWLAPWDTVHGLHYADLNRMAYPALGVLTWDELNGSVLWVGSSVDLDGLSIAEIDAREM